MKCFKTHCRIKHRYKDASKYIETCSQLGKATVADHKNVTANVSRAARLLVSCYLC